MDYAGCPSRASLFALCGHHGKERPPAAPVLCSDFFGKSRGGWTITEPSAASAPSLSLFPSLTGFRKSGNPLS
ncbi:hypothetical protein L596_005469 [Steinernema carpocapsae]|uniref:Uncharacterized protein n=1 Tax=Steinernema carpocapsae TaxID=34508 RepID=A0A4U8UZ75_STECR|nr:hypothetical protein L596_005469 [Steinernema carpocapsae]